MRLASTCRRGRDVPLAQCEGEIVSAFRELKAVYEKLRSDLVGATGRVSAMETVLKGRPHEFQYPKSTLDTRKAAGQPGVHRGCVERRRR